MKTNTERKLQFFINGEWKDILNDFKWICAGNTFRYKGSKDIYFATSDPYTNGNDEIVVDILDIPSEHFGSDIDIITKPKN